MNKLLLIRFQEIINSGLTDYSKELVLKHYDLWRYFVALKIPTASYDYMRLANDLKNLN